MPLYSYSGPVMAFDKCIDNSWKASTWAVSERKARSNLTFRYKQETGRTASSKITLPGKIKLQEGTEGS